jgi:hypothetical protein
MICSSEKRFFIAQASSVKNTGKTHVRNGFKLQSRSQRLTSCFSGLPQAAASEFKRQVALQARRENPGNEEGRIKMSTHLNWRLLLGEFVVIVVGVLMALWVDQLREARVNAELEVEYLESLVVDLDADLAQFDETEAWMRRQEAAAATVLALYAGTPPTRNAADLVAAVETAGWQYFPSITRNTIDDLRSTGNLRLIRSPELRRAIAAYYATVETTSIPLAAMRDRIWGQYDAQVSHVLTPGERLAVLQRPESFGHGISSDAIQAAEAPGVAELTAALRAFPELEIAAGEVLYQTIANRASVEVMRSAALDLRNKLQRWLASGD